jgi:hypothetical protein
MKYDGLHLFHYQTPKNKKSLEATARAEKALGGYAMDECVI